MREDAGRDSGRGDDDAGRPSTNVIRLFGQMLMLPLTVFVYGMDMLVRSMQEARRLADEGLELTAGARTQERRERACEVEVADVRREAVRPHSETEGGPVAQTPLAATNATPVTERRPSHAEETKQPEEEMDRELRDDMLKLVRYKVLFVKREYEYAFPEQEDLVAENMDGSAFTAWKVAEFIQDLERQGQPVPGKWGKYPGGEWVREGRLRGLPHEDKKYLRVYYEVLDRYPRERFKYEEQQVRVLEQIRDELKKDRDGGAGGGSSSHGAGASSGGATSGTSGASPGTTGQGTGSTGSTGTGGTGGTGGTSASGGAGSTSSGGVSSGSSGATGSTSSGGTAGPAPAQHGEELNPADEVKDPYNEIMHRLYLSEDAFERWRNGFKTHSQAFARDIAKYFNQHREAGHVKGLEVKAEDIERALSNPYADFDRRSFDRFTGKALGDLRIHRFTKESPKTLLEFPAPPVHSIWGETREHNGEFKQRITGSNVSGHYVDPDDNDAIWENLRNVHVDLTFNAWNKELGIVSWSSFYQNHSNQMRSIGYEVGPFLLWVNQLLDPDMTPTLGPLPIPPFDDPLVVRKDQLILSCDFETDEGGKRYFNVYAMHIDFDFEKGTAKFAGPILKMKNERLG
jgi:hypothetical protein